MTSVADPEFADRNVLTAPSNMPGEATRTANPARSLFRRSALSIGKRLAVCFLLILVAMIGTGVVAFWQFTQIVAPTRRLSDADQASLALARLRLDLGTFRKNVAALENDHDTEQFSTEATALRQSFLRNVEEAQLALSKAPEISREDPTIPAALKVLKVTLPSQLDTVVELTAAGDWTAVHLRLGRQIQDLIDLSSSLVLKVDRQAQQQRSKAIEDTATAQKRLFIVALITGSLTLLLAVALGWYVTQSITVPLAELASGAQALARGDFHHQVNVTGSDELTVVGRAFNHAARQLREQYEEVREQASLLSLTHDSVYVCDMKGVVRYWNRGAEVLFGWAAEHAVGEVAHELLKTVFPVTIEQIHSELLSTGHWEGELSKTKKDGTQMIVASRWSLKRDERGEPVAILVTSNDITQRTRAEEALRRSETYLSEAQRLTHTGSWAWNPLTGECFYWSEEMFQIFELDPRQGLPTSEPFWNRIHPEDRESMQELLRNAAIEKKHYKHEHRIVLPKGTVKYIHAIGHPVLDEAGELVEFVGTAMDVTDRKRAEESLRDSETRFRTFVDHAADALFVLDCEQGTIVDVNREACESLGYTRQELIGTAPAVFHLESDRVQMDSVAERAAAGETVFDTHYHRRKDGRTFPVEVNTSSFCHAGRRFLLQVARDISDRLRAEEAVRQSEKQLREVIETMPAIAWTSSPDGSVEFVNKRWQEYTGMSPDQAVGSGWTGAVHPKDLDRYVNRRRASLASGDPIEDEIRIRCGGTGEYRWFISRAVPLRDGQGSIIRWYGTATDIQDRKQAEERLQVENVVLREEIDKASMFEEVVGASPPLRAVLSAVAKVAPTDSTVLITGETGTGKELIARAIHKKSPRSAGTFIPVNCSAIPESLITSELFGHEKGAFTGALQRRLGRFELAERGTIFLDEVGELPLETQVALLRVLQEREIQRVGGSQAIRVNVRVLAATNRNLQKAIAEGRFREDLFYRLNVFPIHIPPLRERKEDIPMLVEYFIDRFARMAGKNIRSIEKRALELLESYSWPGNIRELQNVVERSVIVCETDTLSIDENWLSLGDSQPHSPAGSMVSKIHAQEREFIEKALAEAEGKVSGPSGAAAKLGISPSALEYKIRLLKINKHQFKKYLRES